MPDPDPKKPTTGERLSRAAENARPRIEQAAAAAAPKVEKAAQTAGGWLGTLRERAKETAKQFSEGYGAATVDGPGTPAAGEETPPAPPAGRPRPRPRPGPRADG
jgi:hypothetical protein